MTTKEKYVPLTAFNNLNKSLLKPGTTKKGVEYVRSVGFQPGMKELVEIVAGLQKDMKRINKCLTLEGATEYAAKMGDNWEAKESDITGPNGKPDGINEVYITDGKGNIKVINGWTLKKTDNLKRRAYYTQFPTRDQRKETPYTIFKQRIRYINPNLVDGEAVYGMEPVDFGGEQFASIRKEITPKDYFKQLLFNPYFETKKELYKQSQIDPMKQAQLFNKGLSTIYNRYIRDRIFGLHQMDANGMKKAAVNKTLKSEEYKREAFNLIQQLSQESFDDAIVPDFDVIMGEVEQELLPLSPFAQAMAHNEDY